jgi:hypothetical protein
MNNSLKDTLSLLNGFLYGGLVGFGFFSLSCLFNNTPLFSLIVSIFMSGFSSIEIFVFCRGYLNA